MKIGLLFCVFFFFQQSSCVLKNNLTGKRVISCIFSHHRYPEKGEGGRSQTCYFSISHAALRSQPEIRQQQLCVKGFLWLCFWLKIVLRCELQGWGEGYLIKLWGRSSYCWDKWNVDIYPQKSLAFCVAIKYPPRWTTHSTVSRQANVKVLMLPISLASAKRDKAEKCTACHLRTMKKHILLHSH